MLYVHGIGDALGPNVLTNDFFESLDIGTSAAWIEQRTGIRERRTCLPLSYIRETRNTKRADARDARVRSPAQSAADAARGALTRANLRPSDLGISIAGGSAPEQGSPAMASLIAQELDIDVPAFDVNAACTTFLAQLLIADQFADAMLGDFALLTQAEDLTRVVDYTDRSTAVLMGDASSAVIISKRHPSPTTIVFERFGAAPREWEAVRIDSLGHLQQDGNAVQRFAVRRTTQLLKELELSDPVAFIGHQANLRMLESVVARTWSSAVAHWYNVDRVGNTGSAGAVSVLSHFWDAIPATGSVAIAVVGAGLSWGSAVVRRTA